MLRKRTALLALLLAAPVLASFSAGAPAAGVQEDKEPPLVMYLESGGKKIPIEPDKPFDLETNAGKTNLILRVEPYRVFQYAGLYFHYPRGASFKAQIGPGFNHWMLTEGTSLFMIQQFKGQSDPKQILKEMARQMPLQYGKSAEVKQEETSIDLQKKPVKGVRLEVAFENQTIHQSLFAFASGKDTVVLILQDAPDEGGKASRTFLHLQKMLQDSFRFPSK